MTNQEGLRGMSSGSTAICTVGVSGTGLTYCGYDITELAENATFEEVAYLILNNDLPNKAQLDNFIQQLKNKRELPEKLKRTLELIPASAHPMDVMRSGCSALGVLETEIDFSNQYEVTLRLLATFPGIINYWYHYSHNGKSINTQSDENTIGGHFLALLHGKKPHPDHVKCMAASLILYAEHEFNASTFAARVCASTLSDMHSSVCAAIGTLRGPLHGGANEAAMDMLEKFNNQQHASDEIHRMLDNKIKIMGFGHAVYKTSDPRNAIIKKWSHILSQEVGDTTLYPVSEVVEKTMWDEKKLFANADFYHASAYHFMGIPTKLFTPIFVCSRTSGWCGHIFEQRANNRIIRPSADYIGHEPRNWVNIENR